LIGPAVDGTLNVLASCAKARTKKVILTSSTGAVYTSPNLTSTSFVDESWWSDPEFCRKNKVSFDLLDLDHALCSWIIFYFRDFLFSFSCNMVGDRLPL
jgi:nucleoside-diphosphate-sugar epimerase